MNILIISDEPTLESFRQILALKRDIEDITKKQVDLITFSHNRVFLNQKPAAGSNEILTTLETALKRKKYSVLIISLTLKYLKQLFPEGFNILDLIDNISPETTVFIFGAKSLLKTIGKRKQVFSHPRRGVAKLTQEFKDQIIAYIKSLR